MPSATEPSARGGSPVVNPDFRAGAERWNRKLHIHVGLFLLFFLWLFALSGLLLNHPTWTFANYWEKRKETTYERAIVAPGPEVKGDLAQAREILRQLGIDGEILWTTTGTNGNQFDFQVRRPGHYFFIKTDPAQRRATIRQAEVDIWGVMKALHAFTGVQMDDARQRRDWVLTTVWAFSMDAVAAGVMFLVFSSLYMWLKLPEKRLWGAFALFLGSVMCGLFCFGLRWFF